MKRNLVAVTVIVGSWVGSLFASSPLLPVISAERVEAALRKSSIDVDASQISFFTDVFANDPNAEVELVSIAARDDLHSTARLRCRVRAACLPFLVDLQFRSQQQQISATGLTMTQAQVQTGSAAIKKPPIAVRAGEMATLSIEGSQLAMTLQVTCLESGAVGSSIRARSKDNKIFRARVVGPGILRSSI